MGGGRVKPMTVLLADDHTLVRAGIRALLKTIPGVKVVAEAGEGFEALDLIRRHQPDIAILDITMPGLNGLEIAEAVKKEVPRTKVIVLSMHASESYVARALQAGVVGYLRKNAAVGELPAALESVAAGDIYLSPGISRQVVEALRTGGVAPDPLQALSPRQREILQMIAEGKSAKEIAFDLGISVKTVETHRAQLMERLGIHNVQGLIRLAIRAGLISAEE